MSFLDYAAQQAHLERTGQMRADVAAQWTRELQERSDADWEAECEDRAMGGRPAATEMDAEREYVYNYGMDHPDHAWINSPRDCTYANPHYVGPPVPHPDDLEEERNQAAFFEPGETQGITVWMGLTPVEYNDDDIPF